MGTVPREPYLGTIFGDSNHSALVSIPGIVTAKNLGSCTHSGYTESQKLMGSSIGCRVARNEVKRCTEVTRDLEKSQLQGHRAQQGVKENLSPGTPYLGTILEDSNHSALIPIPEKTTTRALGNCNHQRIPDHKNSRDPETVAEWRVTK